MEFGCLILSCSHRNHLLNLMEESRESAEFVIRFRSHVPGWHNRVWLTVDDAAGNALIFNNVSEAARV